MVSIYLCQDTHLNEAQSCDKTVKNSGVKLSLLLLILESCLNKQINKKMQSLCNRDERCLKSCGTLRKGVQLLF